MTLPNWFNSCPYSHKVTDGVYSCERFREFCWDDRVNELWIGPFCSNPCLEKHKIINGRYVFPPKQTFLSQFHGGK